MWYTNLLVKWWIMPIIKERKEIEFTAKMSWKRIKDIIKTLSENRDILGFEIYVKSLESLKRKSDMTRGRITTKHVKVVIYYGIYLVDREISQKFVRA